MIWLLVLLVFLLILLALVVAIGILVLLIVTGVLLPITFREFKELKTQRKQTKLASLRAQIAEFESSITAMSADVQSMDKADDYASEEWQARRKKRLSAVENDREQLALLKTSEARLKRDLGIA